MKNSLRKILLLTKQISLFWFLTRKGEKNLTIDESSFKAQIQMYSSPVSPFEETMEVRAQVKEDGPS